MSIALDGVTVVSILPAIADLGALDLGRWVHKLVQRKKLDRVINICTALIDMYSKCGETTEAKRLFDEMPEKETASWNALINGFAVNGHGKEALEGFLEMQCKKFMPNNITFIGVLSACNHCGLVEEGKRWFKGMEGFGLILQIEHYGCTVDLLGRAGCLEEVEKLIESMPYDANGIILSSFLFACGHSEDVTRANKVLKKAVKVEPWNDGNYVMLRNLYAGKRRWSDAEEIKRLMRKNQANKEVGCSVIEVDGRIKEFVAGDRVHAYFEAIHFTLRQTWKHLMGKPSAEMFTFAMGRKISEILRSSTSPLLVLYQAVFKQWKKAKEEDRENLLIEFLKKNVKLGKVDDTTTTMITGILIPQMAMAAKRTVEIVLQLKMIEAIPDILFIPSAAVLVLIYASNSIRNRDGVTISDVLFVISEMLALIYAKISNMMTYSWIFQHHPPAADGTRAKRTGSASASRTGPSPTLAVTPAAEKRQFSPGFRSNFAGSELLPPVTDSDE
ncbi:hypothetical protein L3X38_012851 [Prunus dulcis]|uniref:Pentatricopeptide repeat-containing protein n=1 Tax=Prunus dulcis TaxID=3755 RepID=A0AAD4WLS1_PRUDU|nr:hypothetical protein L3X38_012851 [Prunus dulcis]